MPTLSGMSRLCDRTPANCLQVHWFTRPWTGPAER